MTEEKRLVLESCPKAAYVKGNIRVPVSRIGDFILYNYIGVGKSESEAWKDAWVTIQHIFLEKLGT